MIHMNTFNIITIAVLFDIIICILFNTIRYLNKLNIVNTSTKYEYNVNLHYKNKNHLTVTPKSLL